MAGWGALDTALGRLPLAAVDLDVRVMGLAMTTEVRQVFVNHHATPLEATYVFPLPDRAAVQRFRMTAGDRVIEGELDERGRRPRHLPGRDRRPVIEPRWPRRIAPACSR
jgi:Ca-activated chloride channel family protein